MIGNSGIKDFGFYVYGDLLDQVEDLFKYFCVYLGNFKYLWGGLEG